jgi:hypothetical protein
VLGRVISQSEFAARLPVGTDVDAALTLFASGAPLRTRRASDGAAARHGQDKQPHGVGLDRMVDVRKSLLSFSRVEGAPLRASLDWPDGELVRFRVAVSHEGSARPIEVCRALFGDEATAHADLARLGLWGGAGGELVDPLDTATLRHRPAIIAAPEADGPAEPPSLSL